MENLNWWEILCLGLATMTACTLFGVIVVKFLVGWGMGLQKREKG